MENNIQPEKPKKKLSPIAITIIVLGCLSVCCCFGGIAGKNSKTDENTSSSDVEKPESSQELTDEIIAEETEQAENTSKIILKADEENEYSKKIIMNEGNEFEEELCVFFLPEGKYSAKNITDKPFQVNVYDNEFIKNDNGYDEYSNCSFVSLVGAGETVEFDILNDQFIEIHKSAELEVTRIGDVTTPVQEDEDSPIEFIGDVPNDVTGNWRLSKCYEHLDMKEYAVEYYNKYFEDDSEIHFIVNKADETTSVVSVLLEQLNVRVYNYVEDEEYDAKIIPSGDLISEDYIPFNAESDQTQSFSNAVIMNALEYGLEQGFGSDDSMHYEIEYDNETNTYSVTTYIDNLAIAMVSDKENAKSLIEAFKDFGDTTYDSIKSVDETANFSFILLNDINKDLVIFAIYDGIVITDATN